MVNPITPYLTIECADDAPEVLTVEQEQKVLNSLEDVKPLRTGFINGVFTVLEWSINKNS